MPGETKLNETQKLMKLIKLYEDYPRDLVKHRLDLTDGEFDSLINKAVRRKIISRGYVKDIEKYRELSKNMSSEPYSYKESDYGHNERKKIFITKRGILTFNGNEPIKKPFPTSLQIAVKEYKNALGI